MPERFVTYVEVGTRRAFAGAVEWPGRCRSGRDEAAAVEALVAYGPRYAKVLRGTRLRFGGGRRWLPRYFARRVAWHVLDHAWEIEDRGFAPNRATVEA